MDQRMQVRSMLVAEGEGVLDLKDRLSCSLGRFYTLGARQGDGVRLTTPDGKEAYGRVLQVASDTTLVLDGLPDAVREVRTRERATMDFIKSPEYTIAAARQRAGY